MTKNRRTLRANWAVAIFVATYFFLTSAPARAQLDETCTVTINGQTVNVGFGGEFQINNIPAGVNLVRAYAICTKDGKTRYGRSGFFQIRPNQGFTLSELDMVFRDTPFPTTSAIRVIASSPILTAIGQTTQMRVIATLSDSTQKDVTSRGFGSTYLTSNPNVATVNEQGVVTATGVGTAFITANNEGAAAVTRITAAPAGLLTTVEGFVQYEDGTPAIGATLIIPGHGESTITDSQGRFSIPNVFSRLGPFRVRAYQIVNNQLRLDVTGRLPAITGGVTDAGIIVIKPATNFVYWTSPVNGSWHDATKWSAGRVPAAADNVFIGVPGNITVTYSQGTTTIKSLLCDENFIVSGGTSLSLTDTSEISGNFSFNTATLVMNRMLSIYNQFNWIGGALNGVGPLAIATSGLMTISGATNNITETIINNAGNVTWSGGNIFLRTSAGINNLVGAIFNAQTNAILSGTGSTSTFTNAGTFRRSVDVGTTTINIVPMTNTGTIEVSAGTLILQNNISTAGGGLNVASGATLDLNNPTGTYSWSGTAGVGTGTVRLITGTLRIEPGGAPLNFTGSGFLFNGGTITGLGTLTNTGTFNGNGGTIAGLGVLTNTGTFNWSGGSITGLGTLTNTGIFGWTGGTISGQSIINNTGAFNISGNSLKDFIGGATINNTATVTWTGTGQIRGGASSVFNNLAIGTFDIQVDATFSGGAFGGTPTAFNNTGRVVKSAGSGTATLEVRFNNTGGAINVQSGTLIISLTSNHRGGTFNVAIGTILNLSGTHVFSGSHSGLVEGLIQFGTLQIDTIGATFNFTGKGFTWTGGTIIGPGILTNTGLFSISGSSLKDFIGDAKINNAGKVTWSGTGQVRGGGGPGSAFNNLAGATFNIQDDTFWNGGAFGGTPTTFNNSGTIIKSDSSGTATLQVRFNNTGGTVNVQSGILALSLGGNSTGGIFTAANGANLNFSGGTHIFSRTYSGSVAGFVQLTGGTLQIDTSGATFNFTGSGFRLSGGTITGPGTLTNSGTFDLAGGSISGQGIINNNGTFNITGSSFKDFIGGATINNTATVTWTGAGQIRGGAGSVLNNLINGTFDIQIDATFSGVAFGGTPTAFNNAGKVQKSAGTGTCTLVLPFNNTGGAIEVQSGTLALSSGGNTTGGRITVANGMSLNLTGTHVFSGSYSGSIDGSVNLGTLQIAASGATFNFTGGGFKWTSGTITGPGTLANIGLFSIAGSSFKDFIGGATINNTATVTWTGAGQIRGGAGSVFNNLANGTLDIQVDATFSGVAFGGTPTAFNNAGTVQKSAGTGTCTLALPFNNTGGAIEVQSGTLALSSGGNSTGGRITVASGTNLNLSSAHVFSGSYSGSVDGSVSLGTLQIASSGATFNFTGGGFKWANGNIIGPGTLANTGLFSIPGSSFKDFTNGASISNSGTVIWNGTGQIRGGSGSVFNNLANGTFDIQVDATFSGAAFGGTPTAFSNVGVFRKSAGTGTTTLSVTPFNNSGTVNIQTGILSFSSGYIQQTSSSNIGITISGTNPGTGFGQHITTGGITTLDGNLNVSLNFTPSVGNSFQVMTFVNRNNTQFAKINLPSLPPGLIWGPPVYTNTSLTLSVVVGGAEQ